MKTWEYIVLSIIVLVFVVTITAGVIVAIKWDKALKERKRIYGIRKE